VDKLAAVAEKYGAIMMWTMRTRAACWAQWARQVTTSTRTAKWMCGGHAVEGIGALALCVRQPRFD